MSDKIFDFSEACIDMRSEAAAAAIGEELKKTILKGLCEIPPDTTREYVRLINASIDEGLSFKGVILAADKPNLAAHLLKGLSHVQLLKLKDTIVNLIMYAKQKSVNEIVNGSLKISGVTASSLVKARRLFLLLKEMPSSKSDDILESARLLQVLSTIVSIYGNESTRPFLEDKLAKLPEEELDKLLHITIQTTRRE